jgi:negative regulator of replication initiation
MNAKVNKTITVIFDDALYAKLSSEARKTYTSKASVLRRLVFELESDDSESSEVENSQIEPQEKTGVFDNLFAGWKNAQ